MLYFFKFFLIIFSIKIDIDSRNLMFWFMVLAGANSLNMVLCLVKNNNMEYNSKHGRIYLISYRRKSWPEASSFCQKRSGNLASIYEPSTIPEMTFTKQNRTFWVGLQWNETGSLSKWTNWYRPPTKPSKICGAVMLHTPYMWYAMECSIRLPFICEIRDGDCNYMEIKNSILGDPYDAHRTQVSLKQCKQICEEGTLGFTCKSFVRNIKHSFCQFSKRKRWMSNNYTLEYSENWNYYQKNCTTKVIVIEEKNTTNNFSSLVQWTPTSMTVYSTESISQSLTLSSAVIPSEKNTTNNFSSLVQWTPTSMTVYSTESISQSLTLSSTVIPSVTDRIDLSLTTSFLAESNHFLTESLLLRLTSLTSWYSTSEQSHLSTSFTILPIETSKLVYCTEVCIDKMSKTVVHSRSSVFLSSVSWSSSTVYDNNTPRKDPFSDMESMNQRIKDKMKNMKKISIPDNRISSISLGTVGIAIIISVFAFIVVLDLFKLRCCYMKKKDKRKHCVPASLKTSPHHDADNFTNIYKPSSIHSMKIINSNKEAEEPETSTKL